MAAEEHDGVIQENDPCREEARREYKDLNDTVEDGNTQGVQSSEGSSILAPKPVSPSMSSASRAKLASSMTRGNSLKEQRSALAVDKHRSQDEEVSWRTTELSSTPSLSTDTRRVSNVQDTRVDEGSSGSSLGNPSPTSSGTSRARFLPPNLPIPTRTRDRGFSLRRALLARNINGQSQGNGSLLEMQAGLRPTHVCGSSQLDSGPYFNKKSGTTITIAPMVDDVDRALRPAKAVQKSSFLPHYESWVKNTAAKSNLLVKLKTLYHKASDILLHIHNIPCSKDGRHLHLDESRKESQIDERTGRAYIDNVIRSCRYTVWNFLPRQLFAQFSKLANFYFLCVSILQMIPGLSTTGNYTTIVPLTFFVTLSMAKEGYDDMRRYRLDKGENNRLTSILEACNPVTSSLRGSITTNRSKGLVSIASEPKHLVNIKWRDVRVGDIVRLARDEAAPADLVILNAKGMNGIAYVETMALDGETNLKSKEALPSLARNCGSFEAIRQCEAHFVVEDPNLDLYNFEGKCSIAGETLPLTNSEIVYRGSILRNTAELYGMVIYTGEECKIRMNATKNPRIKAPSLQAVVNKVIIIIVLFVLALATFNTIAYQIWSEAKEEKSWYLQQASVAFFPILSSFIILFNTMVPLSLYVSLEVVKLFQLVLMDDVDMYDEDSNTPMEARTSTINEELGQVNYIFSDKTGTLTNNSMQFQKMSVAGTAWLHDPDIEKEAIGNTVQRTVSKKPRCKGKKPMRSQNIHCVRGGLQENSDTTPPAGPSSDSPWGPKSSSGSGWKRSTKPSMAQPELRTAELLRYIQVKPHTTFARKTRMFLLSISLCHTCIPERREDGAITYQAASPDEQALVRAAQELGYMVIDRQNASITLQINPLGDEGELAYEIYQILDVIGFSSNRKRMSIIVRMPDNRICVFCKGADSTIAQLLRLSSLAIDKAILIERRVSKRKSLEAQEAIRRDSEHRNRKTSMARSSLSMNRHSLGGIPRPSLVARRLRPIRDDFDHWLRDRETDVDFSSQDNQAAYTPRPSVHFPSSPTFSPGSGRSSFQGDESEELVEEAMVVDDAVVFERCFQHINDFATEGLRTLLYGYRFLEEDEYNSWKKLYRDASTSLTNRQAMVEKAGNLVETNLELAGATAIEDKLQDGVPEAIEKLRRAKIKLWMLTGDKRETAINIGHSCRLIKDYSSITILDHETGEVEQCIANAFVEINRGQVAHSVVVVDGQTLALIEANDTVKKLFIDLAVIVDSVICCRASPAQKAYLVHTICKKVKNAVTLAIGDGANDIAMIQEAHVGIGITGKEGLQAARTSDYSIAQFRFLLKLLLVHGRWNYIRTCKYTLGTFWKEMLFFLTQALYQRYAGYTGTSLYESWSLSMFNTLFTSLPVIFLGIFEKDLAPTTLLAVPELYTLGHHNGGFNLAIYAWWVFMASAEAMIIFFIMLGLYGQALFTADNNLYAMGTLTFSACVLLIVTKLQFLEIHNKSITCLAAMFLSIGGWCLWDLILSALYTNNVIYNVRDGFLQRFGRNALWWLTLILIVVACWAFEIAAKSIRMAWAPGDIDMFQELEKDEGVQARLELAADLGMNCHSSGDSERDEEIRRAQAQEGDAMTRLEQEEEEEEEEQRRREDDVRLLLERPRAVMGATVVRRRQLSEGGGAGGGAGIKNEYLGERPKSQGDDGEDGNQDDSGAKAKRHSRRSVDVHELLRRGFGSVRRSLEGGRLD